MSVPRQNHNATQRLTPSRKTSGNHIVAFKHGPERTSQLWKNCFDGTLSVENAQILESELKEYFGSLARWRDCLKSWREMPKDIETILFRKDADRTEHEKEILSRYESQVSDVIAFRMKISKENNLNLT